MAESKQLAKDIELWIKSELDACIESRTEISVAKLAVGGSNVDTTAPRRIINRWELSRLILCIQRWIE